MFDPNAVTTEFVALGDTYPALSADICRAWFWEVAQAYADMRDYDPESTGEATLLRTEDLLELRATSQEAFDAFFVAAERASNSLVGQNVRDDQDWSQLREATEYVNGIPM